MNTSRFVVPAVLAAACFSAAFHALDMAGVLPWHVVYNDILHFYGWGMDPGRPYLEKPIEYPVLTGLFIQGMVLLRRDMAGYYALTCAALAAAALAATALLSRLAEDPKRLLRYWALAPSMAFFLVFNWDIFAVLATVGALYCFSRGRDAAAGVCLALGFSAKFYPVIYLIPLLIAARTPRRAGAVLAGFTLAALAVNLPFAWVNFRGWSYFYDFNAWRRPNPDSFWMLVHWARRGWSVGTLNALSAAAFVSLYAFLMRRFRAGSAVLLCYAATLAFLLTTKIFSPQYTLWLLPFFVLLKTPPRWFYALELSNLAVLFAILPFLLLARDARFFFAAGAFVLVRHLALMALLFDAEPRPAV